MKHIKSTAMAALVCSMECARLGKLQSCKTVAHFFPSTNMDFPIYPLQ